MPRSRGKGRTDDVLCKAPKLSSWKSLTLEYTSVTDAGIECLSKATSLVELGILGGVLTEESLVIISKLPQLRSVFLWEASWVTDRGIKELSRMHQLRELYLDASQITDEGVSLLTGLQELWSLDLNETKISDRGLEKLSALPKLGILSLNGTQIEGFGFETFRDPPSINIYLERSAVCDAGIRVLARRCPRIRRLSLTATNVTDESVAVLAPLNLWDLRLEKTAVADFGVERLLGHPTLEVLYVGDTKVTRKMITRLKAKSRRLTVYD